MPTLPLTGRGLDDSYKDLLQVGNANAGIDGTLRPIADGEGTDSALSVSTTAAKVTGNLEVTGALVGAVRFAAEGSPENHADITSGVTDAKAAMQAAIDAVAAAGGGVVRLSAKTYLISDSIILKSRVSLQGAGRGATVIKLANGVNKDVVTLENAYSLFGTNDSGGAIKWGLRDLTLDGNRLNQSPADPDTCNGLAYYGTDYLVENVDIINVKGHGIRSEWYQYGETSGGLESEFINVSIDICGRNGWWCRGPHDHHSNHLVVIDAGQEANDTYYGVRTEHYSGGRFFNLHVWHRSTVTNRAKYGLSSGGANEVIAAHLEGCRGQLEHRGAGDRIVACNFYASRGAAGSAMVSFKGNENIHVGCRYSVTATDDVYAIEFANSASGNQIGDCYFNGFILRSPFNFLADGGLNTVRGRGYCAAGGVATFGGTQAASTRVDYTQGGTAITARSIIQAPDGSVTAPGMSFASDGNTGVYNPAADTMGFVLGGTERVRVDSSGRLLLGHTATVAGSTGVTGNLQLMGTATTSAANFGRFSADNGGTAFNVVKSRGATAGTHGIVSADDFLFALFAEGSDGTAFRRAASITMLVDGAPGSGDMPGRIVFGTTPDGSATVAERMRIDNAGNIGVNGTSFGGGAKVLFIANAGTVPTSNPSGGGVLYVEGGNLRYRGSSGTITTLGVA